MQPEYKYRALYRSNFDGDTLRVSLDLGLGIWNRGEDGKGVVLRLFGLDTPEIRGGTDESKQKAVTARDFVQEVLSTAKEIVVETIKDSTGKYGRYLAIIYYSPGEGTWINLNEELVLRGHAVRKDY